MKRLICLLFGHKFLTMADSTKYVTGSSPLKRESSERTQHCLRCHIDAVSKITYTKDNKPQPPVEIFRGRLGGD